MRRITGILLAAGQSRRFGSNKLLHPLANRVPMVLHAARKLQTVLPHTVVVVDAADQQTIGLLEAEHIHVALNHEAGAGMGSSIACGVRASRGADGWVIALADMPYIKAKTIRQVAAGIQDGDSICAPLLSGRRGHPLGFGKAYEKELMRLSTDEGARRLISANPAYLDLLETHDKGIVADIDLPGDVLAFVTDG